MTPPITTLTSPKGTLDAGETTSCASPIAPFEPTTKDAWLVAIPPIVMLLAAIVPAANPCTSIRRDVGAVPRKLKVVTPEAEL